MPVPKPPANGLILRGYCTYLRHDDKKQIVRSSEFYYKQNPDRWKVETQSDLLWLTEAERKSLIPANPRPGDRHEVAAADSEAVLQHHRHRLHGRERQRLADAQVRPCRSSWTRWTTRSWCCDWKAMPTWARSSTASPAPKPKSRGCELRLLGTVHYDRKKQAITRFDAVGVGRAWGRRTNEIRLDQYPWMYGIACELVTGDAPQDLIPPYNLLHYNPTGPYFGR